MSTPVEFRTGDLLVRAEVDPSQRVTGLHLSVLDRSNRPLLVYSWDNDRQLFGKLSPYREPHPVQVLAIIGAHEKEVGTGRSQATAWVHPGDWIDLKAYTREQRYTENLPVADICNGIRERVSILERVIGESREEARLRIITSRGVVERIEAEFFGPLGQKSAFCFPVVDLPAEIEPANAVLDLRSSFAIGGFRRATELCRSWQPESAHRYGAAGQSPDNWALAPREATLAKRERIIGHVYEQYLSVGGPMVRLAETSRCLTLSWGASSDLADDLVILSVPKEPPDPIQPRNRHSAAETRALLSNLARSLSFAGARDSRPLLQKLLSSCRVEIDVYYALAGTESPGRTHDHLIDHLRRYAEDLEDDLADGFAHQPGDLLVKPAVLQANVAEPNRKAREIPGLHLLQGRRALAVERLDTGPLMISKVQVLLGRDSGGTISLSNRVGGLVVVSVPPLPCNTPLDSARYETRKTDIEILIANVARQADQGYEWLPEGWSITRADNIFRTLTTERLATLRLADRVLQQIQQARPDVIPQIRISEEAGTLSFVADTSDGHPLRITFADGALRTVSLHRKASALRTFLTGSDTPPEIRVFDVYSKTFDDNGARIQCLTALLSPDRPLHFKMAADWLGACFGGRR